MTAVLYTRYTLRLAGGAAVEAAPGRPSRATTPAGAGVAVPVDDWSGVLRGGPDPAALDYRHPDAVALLKRLGVGWQEQDGGDTLVFWLAEGAGGEPGTVALLTALGATGDLRAEAQRPGWEDAWKEFHQPLAVGRLYVRPPWRAPRPGLLDVAVDVARAFGTGGHATTRQCLEEVQLIAPGSLLDLGCGSGVIALAARRLGFAPVWGVDVDPVAVDEAAANAARNDLDVTFSEGDAADPSLPLPTADAVVANIALAPLLRLAGRFVDPAPRPRHLLLAGLLASQREETLAAYRGYDLAAAREDGEWLLLHLEPAA